MPASPRRHGQKTTIQARGKDRFRRRRSRRHYDNLAGWVRGTYLPSHVGETRIFAYTARDRAETG